MDPQVLLKQMIDYGILPAGTKDSHVISDKEKQQLLHYLQKSHGVKQPAPQVTLKRKKESVLELSGNKKVKIDVRTKRIYKRKPSTVAPGAASDVAPKETVQAQADKKATPNLHLLSNKKKTEEKVAKKAKDEALEEVAQTSGESADIAAKVAEDKTVKGAKDAKVTAKIEPVAQVETVAADAKKAKRSKKDRDKEISDSQEEGFAKRKSASKKSAKTAASSADGWRRHKKDSRKRKQAVEDIQQKHAFAMPTSPATYEVEIGDTITVAELAKRMSIKAAEVIKQLMQLGEMATINQPVDQDTATLVVEAMGHRVKIKQENALEDVFSVKYSAKAQTRAPVVTIMGHVDHGKTSLLDYIRKSSLAKKESGGITQHIGAYQINTNQGKITFLDTPGHAAFATMRARGAKVTDIVVLVVAADDGVMPQTIEAIKHAKAAAVPLVVAINKMDKPEANPERVKTELSQHDVLSEEWGGDTQFVGVSAKTGDGVEQLLESISLQAEILELTAPYQGQAKGVVIESRKERGRGAIASLLVQSGTLHPGDILVAGFEFGRVRAMLDENGRTINSAEPSTPVEILGLSGTPHAGEDFVVVKEEKIAKEVAQARQVKAREQKLARARSSRLEGFFDKISETQPGDVAILNLVIKADVHGSAEALADSLAKLSTEEVKVSIVSSGVGGISESDINLALASKAFIIGFNVRADATARQLAETEGVQLNYFSVIYDVIDRIKNLMTGLLAPQYEDKIIGVAQVRDVFRSSKIGAIAGCMVTEGYIKRNNPIRVLRDNIVVYEGELESLRRFKDDVNEVKQGTECGIGVKNYNDVKSGDQIEVYDRVLITRKID